MAKRTEPVKKKNQTAAKKSKTKENKKKSGTSFNYARLAAGFFAVCIIMLSVFLFIIPAVKNDAGINSTEAKDVQKNVLEKEKRESDIENTLSKLSETEKLKTEFAKPEKKIIADVKENKTKNDIKNKKEQIITTDNKILKNIENEQIKDNEKQSLYTEKNYKSGKNAPIPELPELPKKGRLIFVFDDAGHNLEHLKHFVNLPFPCTIAVLPKLPLSKDAAEMIRNAGKEVILHQPMQALNVNIDPGPGAVKHGMEAETIKKIVASNIEELSPIAGMNNHEGSMITADEMAMKAVLELCMEKEIYFLDSRTNVDSVVPSVAASLNFPIWERAVFIDNKKTRDYMEKQIIKGLKVAAEKGNAIMIGHVFTVELAKLLLEMYPKLENEGFVFSTISQLKKE